jgi:hypothetical protein
MSKRGTRRRGILRRMRQAARGKDEWPPGRQTALDQPSWSRRLDGAVLTRSAAAVMGLMVTSTRNRAGTTKSRPARHPKNRQRKSAISGSTRCKIAPRHMSTTSNLRRFASQRSLANLSIALKQIAATTAIASTPIRTEMSSISYFSASVGRVASAVSKSVSSRGLTSRRTLTGSTVLSASPPPLAII